MSEPLVRKEAPHSLHSWSLRLLCVTMWALRMLPCEGGAARLSTTQRGRGWRPGSPPAPPGPWPHRLEGLVAEHAHVAAVLVHQQLDLGLLTLRREPGPPPAGAAWALSHLAVPRLRL